MSSELAVDRLQHTSERSHRWRWTFGKMLSATVLAIVMVVSVFPFVWTIIVSLRDRAALFQQQLVLFAPFSPDGYLQIFGDADFLSSALNSIVLAGVATVITLLLAIPAAYSMARFHVGGRALLMGILALRFFPVAIIIIPAYTFFSRMGLVDRMPAMVTMFVFISLPLALWIIRGFMLQIPPEYEESAMADGCSRLGAVWRITLPLCSQGLVVGSVFPFLYSWNNMLVPLVLTRFRWTTLTTYASIFVTDMRIEWNAVMAVAVVMLVPIALGIIAVKDYLLRGFGGSLK